MKSFHSNPRLRIASALSVAFTTSLFFFTATAQASVHGISNSQSLINPGAGVAGTSSLPPITISAGAAAQIVTYTGPGDAVTSTPGLDFSYAEAVNGDDALSNLSYSFSLDTAQPYSFTEGGGVSDISFSNTTTTFGAGTGTLPAGTYTITQSSFDSDDSFHLIITGTAPEPATLATLTLATAALLTRRRSRA